MRREGHVHFSKTDLFSKFSDTLFIFPLKAQEALGV